MVSRSSYPCTSFTSSRRLSHPCASFTYLSDRHQVVSIQTSPSRASAAGSVDVMNKVGPPGSRKDWALDANVTSLDDTDTQYELTFTTRLPLDATVVAVPSVISPSV